MVILIALIMKNLAVMSIMTYNYTEYTSKADRYENLSPKEYLNVIKIFEKFGKFDK